MSSEERQALKDAVKTVGHWIADETHKRKYPRETVKALSEALVMLKAYFDNLPPTAIPFIPTYEFECLRCKTVFETPDGTGKTEILCPDCGSGCRCLGDKP